MINNEEIVHISVAHIRNISKGAKLEKDNDEKSKDQNKQSQENMSQSELKLENADDEISENQYQDSQENMFQSEKQIKRKRVVKREKINLKIRKSNDVGYMENSKNLGV